MGWEGEARLERLNGGVKIFQGGLPTSLLGATGNLEKGEKEVH